MSTNQFVVKGGRTIAFVAEFTLPFPVLALFTIPVGSTVMNMCPRLWKIGTSPVNEIGTI